MTAAPIQTPPKPPRLGEEILRVKDVCRGFNKTQGELLILDDANLSLREGEIVGLLGRSGSGKSTLLRIIAGLIEPTGGEVTYMGKPLAGPAKGGAKVWNTIATCFISSRTPVALVKPECLISQTHLPGSTSIGAFGRSARISDTAS